MRQILFRGKDVYTENWIEGSFLDNPDKQHGLIKKYRTGSNSATHYGATYHVRRETIGQYTGLNDKNGAMIFEGDVLKINIEEPVDFGWLSTDYNAELSGKVFYSKWDAAFCVRVDDGFIYILDIKEADAVIEIVGNIHDKAVKP